MFDGGCRVEVMLRGCCIGKICVVQLLEHDEG